MRLRLVGESVIELGGVEYTPSAAHFFGLLLRLGVEPDRLQQREELTRWLYPDAGDKGSAAHRARQLLYLAATRGAAINKTRGAVSLSGAELTSNLDEFVSVDQAESGVEVRSVIVLPGYAPEFSEEFGEWLEAYREQANARVRHALSAALDPLRKRADWRRLEARARELLSIDPLSEPGTLALAEALARTGSKERAVALLDIYRREVETKDPSIAVPATVLRKRIEKDNRFAAGANFHTAFVGRADSIAELQNNLREGVDGSSHVSVISGEAGIGKTRLLEEFVGLLSYGGGYSLVELHGYPSEPFVPFSFLATLVPHLLDLRGAAGADPMLRTFLDRLIGAPSVLPDPPSTAVDAQMIADGVRRAFFDLVSAICAEKSCVVCVHDSRALDDASIALLASILAYPAAPAFHIAVVSHALDGASRFRVLNGKRVELRALTMADSQALLRSIDGAAFLPDTTIQWCCDTGAGNPAYLRLLLAECIAAPGSFSVPRDIIAAVDQSIARLPDASQRVLEACVVLADHCDTETLAGVVAISTFELLGVLHTLEQAGLLAYDEARLHVRSAITAERTLARASRSVLNILHHRAATVLEARDSASHQLWTTASHWLAAGQVARALACLKGAWQKALSLGELSQAEHSIRGFLQQTNDPRERIALYDELIAALRLAGNHTGLLAAIAERSQIYTAMAEPDPLAESMAFDALDAILPRFEDPFDHVRELSRFAHSSSLDDARRARAVSLLIVAADSNADEVLAFRAFRDMEELASSSEASMHLRSARIVFHSSFGNMDVAAGLSHEALSGIDKAFLTWPHFRICLNACLALSLTGEVAVSLEALERLHRDASRRTLEKAAQFSASMLSSLSFDAGDLAMARKWYHTAHTHLAFDDSTRPHSELMSVEADIALLEGRLNDARRVLTDMRDSLPTYNAPRYQMDLAAYSIRVNSFADLLPNEDEIEVLLRWHARAATFGRHDDCMEALWTGLVLTGRQDLATTLLREYLLVRRRERRGARYMLRLRTGADPVWAEIAGSEKPGANSF